MNDIEKKNLKRKQIKKFLAKDEFLNRLREEKERNCEQKRKEFENILKIKSYQIKILFTE